MRGRGGFSLRNFGFIYIVFAVLLLCRAVLSFVHTAVTRNKKISTLRAYLGYVRTYGM